MWNLVLIAVLPSAHHLTVLRSMKARYAFKVHLIIVSPSSPTFPNWFHTF